MSAQEYRNLRERLAREFPTESFLIIRYGDHQPQFGAAPDRSVAWQGGRLQSEPKHRTRAILTTYYAHRCSELHSRSMCHRRSTGSMRRICLWSRCEAAGIPLDASFSEQKAILQRCGGNLLQMRSRKSGQAFESTFDRCRTDQGPIDNASVGAVAGLVGIECRTALAAQSKGGKGENNSAHSLRAHVFTRPGSKPEVAALRRDVCFEAVNGLKSDIGRCPFRANDGSGFIPTT